MSTNATLPPAERFVLFLGAMCQAVYDCPSRPEAGPFLGQLWRRLVRLATRFAATLDRASRPQSRSHHTPEWRARAAAAPPQAKRGLVSFGIILRLLPGYNRYREELAQLLSEPDIEGFFQTTPQLSRLVRPLCRLLQLPPPAFPPPAFPAPASATPPAARGASGESFTPAPRTSIPPEPPPEPPAISGPANPPARSSRAPPGTLPHAATRQLSNEFLI